MLNALLQEELLEVKEEREGFRVENIDQANWCFRKIRALQQMVIETNNLADEEVNRIESWRKKENEGAKNSITYFEMLLSDYYKELKEEDPKAKISTPYGKVSSRKSKKWNYNDQEVIEWAAKNGHDNFIRVKEELDKATLKETFKDGIDTTTGEVIPGIEIVEEESITIKVE